MTELTKQQAMSLLGVSERTLERYVKKSKIGVKYITIKGVETPFFDEGELINFLNEQRSPKHKPALDNASNTNLAKELILSENDKSIALNFVGIIASGQLMNTLANKLLLNIKEAAILSGLSQRYLKQAINTNKLKGLKIGKGWKIRRVDLTTFIDKIFEN